MTTKEIRIALAMDTKAVWDAFPITDGDDEYAFSELDGNGHLSSPYVCYVLTATLPVPTFNAIVAAAGVKEVANDLSQKLKDLRRAWADNEEITYASLEEQFGADFASAVDELIDAIPDAEEAEAA